MSTPLIVSAYQGVTASQTIQAQDANGNDLTGFTGSPALTAVVWAGADQAAAATLTPTWVSATAGTISFVLSGATSATIPAGFYEVVISLDDDSQVLRRFYLDLSFAPGTSTYRSLARLSDCQALLPAFFSSGQSLDALPVALEAATVTIENYCGRILALTTFDKLYRPGRTRKIQLDAWPVPILTRLQTDLASVLTIGCNFTTNQIATVQLTASSQSSNTLATLIFNRIASGSLTTTTLTASTYTTVADLVTAINALGGGWYATSSAPYSTWAVSEINANPGTYGVQDGLGLQAFVRDIGEYSLDPATGIIELTENRPQAFRYSDRSYGNGYGWFGAGDPRTANVRARYRAGYATAAADITAGYEPVPMDLRAACVMTTQAIIEAAPAAGPVREQSVKDRSYKLHDGFGSIPESAKLILGKYINTRTF